MCDEKNKENAPLTASPASEESSPAEVARVADTEAKGFIEYQETERTHTFVQWKGTDLCMDFYCDCGAQSHFDGDFAYEVKCPSCEQVWEMPCHLYPRKTERDTGYANPKMLDHEEGETWKPECDICGDQGCPNCGWNNRQDEPATREPSVQVNTSDAPGAVSDPNPETSAHPNPREGE